jgi:ribose 5-phosphate isomerase A
MTVGLGTGSTARFFIEALAQRIINERLTLICVATSAATEVLAQSLGVSTVPLTPETHPDITVDGADEVNPMLDLIKGAGGALVREKLVAQASAELVIVADASKKVATLGAFVLPIAVVPFAATELCDALRRDFEVAARVRQNQNATTPFVTDDGLWIIDLPFERIARPAILEKRLKMYSGVVESGLFIGLARRVYYGSPDGRVEVAYPEE